MHKSLPSNSLDVIDWFERNENRIIESFKGLIACDTSLGKESDLFDLIEKYIGQVGFVSRREAIHSTIKDSPFFSPHPSSDLSSGRENLRAVLDLSATGKDRVLFNCHVDVVPTTKDFHEAFCPHVQHGKLYGRGACDTKNNLVMLVEAIRYIREHGLSITKRVSLDMPIEEEIGGNGTLSTVLHGVDATQVIVLEPTKLEIFRGHRGCLTFEVQVTGKSVHMGGDSSGISAIKVAMEVIKGLEAFEIRLLDEAKQDQDFNVWSRPLQLNVGLIKGGEWVGSVPENCSITCNLGFLPSYSIETLEQSIRQVCEDAVAHLKGVKLNFDFACGLRNDAYIQPKDNDLVLQLQQSVNDVLGKSTSLTHGWLVSCDARYYDKVTNIPVVVFGSGDLNDAHSAHENVEISELAKGTAILVNFLTQSLEV